MNITYTSYYKAGNCPFDDASLEQLRAHHWQIRILPREPRASELDAEICFQAYKDFETPGEGMWEFERLTGLDIVMDTAPSELGGSFFQWGNGTLCYGEGCLEHLYAGVHVKNLRDAVSQLHASRADNQVLTKHIANLEKSLRLTQDVPNASRRNRSDEPLAG